MKTTISEKIENYPHAIVSEDTENWYIDLKTGLGESIYEKCYFTLEEAIQDVTKED